MKMLTVSAEAMETMKRMVEKLDADNKMLLCVVTAFKQRFDPNPMMRMGVQMSSEQLFACADRAIQQAIKEPTAVLERETVTG